MGSNVYDSTGRISGVTVPSDALVDLHMHTTASDGRFTPPQLAKAAHDTGLKVIALADHDRVDNVRPLQQEAAQYGIYVVPAVEVSCLWGETQYHMLVYNVDLTDGRFLVSAGRGQGPVRRYLPRRAGAPGREGYAY